jgi:hypothetical protein
MEGMRITLGEVQIGDALQGPDFDPKYIRWFVSELCNEEMGGGKTDLWITAKQEGAEWTRTVAVGQPGDPLDEVDLWRDGAMINKAFAEWVPIPLHLDDYYRVNGRIPDEFVGRWVSVIEALPPERFPVLTQCLQNDAPEFAWMKYAAGERPSPYFVCAALAGLKERGKVEDWPEEGLSHTHWLAPTACSFFPDTGNGWRPSGYQDQRITLGEMGWLKYPDPEAEPPQSLEGREEG